MSLQYYIGTSGWHYDHWQNLFYPPTLPRKQWLQYYAQAFNSVEINSSYYRMPLESTFANWNSSVPDDFCFSVKASRFITHIKRLKDSREAVETFVSRAKSLGAKLGPLLFQLPPGLHRNDSLLESFLILLNNQDISSSSVFEFRHPSWMADSVFQILQTYHAGFCIFDMPEYTSPFVITSDFMYLRFHGKNDLYSGCYPENELKTWADKIARIPSTLKSIYIYFNNDAGGYAVQNALTLKNYLQV